LDGEPDNRAEFFSQRRAGTESVAAEQFARQLQAAHNQRWNDASDIEQSALIARSIGEETFARYWWGREYRSEKLIELIDRDAEDLTFLFRRPNWTRRVTVDNLDEL
jgi:predicted Zn-dependent protease